jgi:hypothetical protein
MSKVGPEGRSFARITQTDLDRLADLAAADRKAFFVAHPDWAADYAHRYIATALCQGAALHFVNGDAGIQDFDVYSFYSANPDRRWYAKRNKPVDFGDPKFGRSLDRPDFAGRRVDLMGRAIECATGESPIQCIRRWLAAGRTESAKFLAQKAVVLLDPGVARGTIVWPVEPTAQAV